MNQLLNKVKLIIKENMIFIITFFIILATVTFELPSYISMPGGLIDLSDRIDKNTTWSGSLNMTYVSSIKATIPTYIIASINPKWDIVSEEEELGSETLEEQKFRGKITLEESIDNAIINAYRASSMNYEIKNRKIYVTYIYDNAKTDLKVGDQIIKINDITIDSKKEITKYINSLSASDEVEILVINNNKEIKRKAQIIEISGIKLIGILLSEEKEIITNEKNKIDFKNSESGPSGGLMISLAIYSSLTDEDLTNGLKIAGTGTIDEYGNVGEISGVKYKLAGAVKNNADIFIVPNKNLKEAIEETKKNNYNIEIIGVDTFEEVIEHLKN